MPARKPASKKKDSWVGWFKPLNRGFKKGSLVAVPIEIYREDKKKQSGIRKLLMKPRAGQVIDGDDVPHRIGRDLVVSVPGVCGNAVQRNRFKRLVKARFADCVLNGATREEIVVEKETQSNKSLRKSQSRKGLWIRLLNRHRLGQKIQMKDWQKDFDEIEKLFCPKASRF